MLSLKDKLPQFRERIALAKEYGDRGKALSSDYNGQLDAIWSRYRYKIRQAVLAGSPIEPILDSLMKEMRSLLQMLLDNCVYLVCEREDMDYDIYKNLLPQSVQQCNADYYDYTLSKYKDILSSEIAFATEGRSLGDINLFLANPLGYMSSKKGGLLELKRGIDNVDKGVSYSFSENMKKLGVSAAALAFAFGMYNMWQNKGEVGYYFGVRNSTYPCSLCDSYAYEPIPMSQGMIYPLHNRCVCSIVPIYQSELP